MVERSLRGMKIGANSLESETGVSFVERREENYVCANGHRFKVTLAIDAESPYKWECKCGAVAELAGGEDTSGEETQPKPARTHWDMLLERRSKEELEVILHERLELLRSGKLHTRFYQKH